MHSKIEHWIKNNQLIAPIFQYIYKELSIYLWMVGIYGIFLFSLLSINLILLLRFIHRQNIIWKKLELELSEN